jgi:hypothetical protein
MGVLRRLQSLDHAVLGEPKPERPRSEVADEPRPSLASGDGRETYWFPVMRYGYGWGLGRAWQGWVAMAGFLMAAGVVQLGFGHVVAGVVTVFILLPIMCVLIARKGEPHLRRRREGGS